MERILDLDLLKTVLAKNIDVKDTLDYTLYGFKEPGLLSQFLLLGPIFSGLKTKRYFVGVTTSGILFVEVTRKFEEKNHAFFKYYEIDEASNRKVLKGRELVLRFVNGKQVKIVFPRIVLGLARNIDDTESAIRVIYEKIKASKEYFRKQRARKASYGQESRSYKPKAEPRKSIKRGKRRPPRRRRKA